MQTSNRLFDDLARVASGAFNTLSGLREEIETRVRERVERMAADLDLVTREEFEAVRAMAAKAREAQEELEAKVARLEAALAQAKPKASRSARAAGASEEGPSRARKPRATARRRGAAGAASDESNDTQA